MKKVYIFTLIQNLKSSSVKISSLIFCLIVLLSMPVMYYFSDSSEQKGQVAFDTLYSWDQSGLGISDFSKLKEENAKYKNVKFVSVQQQVKLKDRQLMIRIEKENGGYQLNFVVGENGLDQEVISGYEPEITRTFDALRQEKIGINKDQIAYLNEPISTKVVTLNALGKQDKVEETNSITLTQYNGVLGSIVILIMLISFSAGTVSSSVIMEKSNRLVENLMLSVRPINLIVGKVLGALTIVLLQMVSLLVCAVASAFLTWKIFDLPKMILPPQLTNLSDSIVSGDFVVVRVIIIVLFIMLGVLLYAILAALFGAAISKMEDMGEGMKVFNLIVVASAYAAIGMSIANLMGVDIKVFEIIASLIPFVAPFVVPGQLLLGLCPIWLAILSLVVMVVFIVFFFFFVAKIYHLMLLSTGKVIKIKDMIGLVKEGEKNV